MGRAVGLRAQVAMSSEIEAQLSSKQHRSDAIAEVSAYKRVGATGGYGFRLRILSTIIALFLQASAGTVVAMLVCRAYSITHHIY